MQFSDTPTITVAMSMRNASRFLRECIDSILTQTFTDFELLIVDDGSEDESPDIVRSYSDPRIRLITRAHDFITSLNTLLDEAKGKYIARMDADDIMNPERLRIQFEYLERNHGTIAVCSQATRIDSNGNTISHIGKGKDIEHVTTRMMCEMNHICNPTTMVRRNVLKEKGIRYEHDFEYAEDYRFWTRVLLECGPIDMIPENLLLYRNSETQNTARHWEEMAEATQRVKADLVSNLIVMANPGYSDKDIPVSNKKLSLIIPFLNEGEEVVRTVNSFLEHGGKGNVDVIAINDCSYDSFPYQERLSAIPQVSYILNRERLGVAASRDKGVEICRTPYFLLLDAHMRAYDDSWLKEVVKQLEENDRRILCCQTRVLTIGNDGVIIQQPYKKNFGARLTFTNRIPNPGIEWIKEELNPESMHEIIPAVLGAGYGCSKRYWNHIGGLRGLTQYGSDEQMMSLKTWLEGGECVLLKNVILGHIYRSWMPYSYNPDVSLMNSLVISETLFPLKEKCKARAVALLANRKSFHTAYGHVKELLESESQIKMWCEFPNQRSFEKVKKINRESSPLESKLKSQVLSKLPDIAALIVNSIAPDNGIYEGKTAYAIWLFHYANHIHDGYFLSLARKLINEAMLECDKADISFKKGVSGLGWALHYLNHKGYISIVPDELSVIDGIISKFVLDADLINPNLSFKDGFSGILAYYCIRGRKGINPELIDKLDKAAKKIISNEQHTTLTESYYAFLWLEMGLYQEANIVDKWALSDWANTGYLLSKDKKFWKLSLFDGILATSISFL